MTAPNLNDHLPWSDLALEDLRMSLESGDSIETAAVFLCRNVKQVRDKAREMGWLTGER